MSQQPQAAFHAAAPHFLVPDVLQAAQYYRDTFGFEIDLVFGHPEPVFVRVRRDQVALHFNRSPEGAARPNRDTYDAYFFVHNVDVLQQELRAASAKIVEGPVDRSYRMRELVVRDPNGFTLCFGQDVGAPSNQ